MSAKKDRPSAHRRPPRARPRALRAPAKRATQPAFVRQFSLRGLGPQLLPLGPPGPASRWPPRHYRSWYRPVGQARRQRYWARALADPRRRPSWFELALHLLDCAPLRAALPEPASARGEKPFDPLSLLLVCLWKIATVQPWGTVASVLADPVKGAAWRQLFGFALHDTPSESALRAFRDRLPDDFLNQVQRLFLQTLYQAELLPPVEPHGYILTGDGQLHDARTSHRCHHAAPACYEPLRPGQTRPCPAQEETQGRYGCACDTPDCQARCGLAPRLDPAAGFVIYSATKRNERGEKVTQITRAVFGYRSAATRVVDVRCHHAWTVRTDLYAAPTDEGVTFPTYFTAAYQSLPERRVAYALYDAACAEQQCLDAVYDIGGIPLFDIKADPSDDDPQLCQARGYDAYGHPFCPHGHHLTYQGIDHRRQPRARWVCGQACRRTAAGAVADCPWLAKKRGYHCYLTRTFRDGSYRLPRLVPYHTPGWDKCTGWRNVSEGRNSVMQRLGLKRLPDYGLRHAAFLITGADVVENLSTLARLVFEATSQDEGFVLPEEQAPWPLPGNEPDATGAASAPRPLEEVATLN
jgi:hypothetical protein